MERKPIEKKIVRISFLILMVLVFGACSVIGKGKDEGEGAGSATVFGDQLPLTGEATLLCTQECRDHGFCGALDTGQRVILLNTQTASTENYDLMLPHNTPVSINVVEPRTAFFRYIAGQILINYYQVTNPTLGQGWVAGWCVGQ